MNIAISREHQLTAQGGVRVSAPIAGKVLTVGDGFEATSFRAREVGELMDPLVMVDHYVMTRPTFGEHPHAGMSAVSLLFEDSEGRFRNRDSLGNDFDLRPGDLYWLRAGRGAIHDEAPRANARTHGLQVFVNVPQRNRFEAPDSLLVRSEDMPVISSERHRVKVVMGESNGIRGAISPSIPMTILDGVLGSGGVYTHDVAANRGLWLQSVDRRLEVEIDGIGRTLPGGKGLAIEVRARSTITIKGGSSKDAHFVLFDGERIAESFVQDGPFVMGTHEQISQIKAAYAAGQFPGLGDNA